VGRGIDQMRAEMARQHRNAADSFDTAGAIADQIAAAIRDRGRLVCLGMGGSHWINRAACPHYATAGIDATCHVVSEYIRAPLPGNPAMLVTSQSGNSGEILRLFDLGLAPDRAFGLTLDADSGLGQRLPSLVGVGGPEAAYAATRSQLVGLALHAALLARLGCDMTGARAALDAPPQIDAQQRERAIAQVAAARAAVLVARGVDQGVMDAAGLCLMEIARMPVLGLEAGQFRHGPIEMVGPDTAMVMLRSAGPQVDDIAGLVGDCVGYGIRPIVFDASGRAAIDGALTVALDPARGLALSLHALPAIQDVLITAADRMVPDAGMPRRSTKVTSGEADR
jgi:fructoselysine-6-P-deglycase FrlB-like protein